GSAFSQRYHLRPQRERGLHWRGMLVSYARWPAAIAGFMDTLSGSTREYALNNKAVVTKAAATRWTLRVHALVFASLAAATAAGFLMPGESNPVVLGFMLWIGGMSLAIVLAERFITLPPAYDDELAARELGPMPRVGHGAAMPANGADA
ncbi:MAG: hypothetical protein ACOC1G_04750, partial [Phycisphaeraceae bacterium]